MKKYIKYLFAIISVFFFLESNVMATTIIETTNSDDYDTIESGSMIIGVTKFNPDVVLTAARVAKAGANDATLYMKKNNGVDGYNAPSIYVYYGVGGWYELDDDNNAEIVSNEELIDKLSKQEIYYVNNVEKKIDVALNGVTIDETKLPDGVSLKDDKLLVNASLNEFTIYTADNKEVNYINDNGSFIVNNAVCYVTSNGYITDYNDKCLSDVVIPEELNGEKIVGVKENAFNNKGITSVVINKNIMNLENNAFANNSLTSVVIKEKYDKTDFTTYGNNVFGDFEEDKIVYENDLTKLLNEFNNENTIKVKEGLVLEKWDVATALMHNETKRLNIEESETPAYARDGGSITYIYNSKAYDIYLCFDDYCTDEPLNENEMILNISLVDNNKSVSKKITYELEEVKVDNKVNETINKATKEIEEYLKSINEEFMSGNYNIALFDQKEVEKIISNNNLFGMVSGFGEGEIPQPIEVTDKIGFEGEASTLFLLISDDVVVENSFEVKYYSNIYYEVTNIEGEFASVDEKIEAVIKDFEKETNIANYNIIKNGESNYHSAVTKDKDGNTIVRYTVSIFDEDTNNHWIIRIDEKEEDPMIVDTFDFRDSEGNIIKETSYNYYPSISFEDYNTTVEFKTAAIEKLASKVGVDDFSDYNSSFTLLQGTSCKEIDGKYECKYEPNEDGIYEYHYVVHLYPNAGPVDGKLTTYTIHLYKYLNYEIVNNDNGLYEVEIDPNNFVGKAEEYKNEVINKFVTENNITDYEVGYSDGFYLKDEETNEFTRYEGAVNPEMTNVYDSLRITDHSINKLWIVLYPHSTVIYDQISN